MKASLIIIALALLACLVWLGSRPDEPVAASVPDTSRGPSFEVHVEKPRLARFLFGILPTKLEAKLFGNGGYLETAFDHTSRGAEIGSVGHDRLELRADGWDLLIETDGEGGSLRGRASCSRSSSRKGSGGCAADPQIGPWAISAPPRGQAPTCSTAASSSSSPPAKMPRRGRPSSGRRHRSPSAGASRACHTSVARAQGRPPNAGHQRRARTSGSDKPCVRGKLIARPVQ